MGGSAICGEGKGGELDAARVETYEVGAAAGTTLVGAGGGAAAAGADEVAAAAGTGAAEAEAGVDPEPEPEPEPDEPEPDGTPLGQTGGAGLAPGFWTRSGPGLGNMTSVSSVVEHPLPAVPTLATKMEGRDLKAVLLSRAASSSSLSRLALPPPMVTEAQFMYISRLPTSLNQVQVKRAAPLGASLGTVKSKLELVTPGHPPTTEPMTVKVLPPS